MGSKKEKSSDSRNNGGEDFQLKKTMEMIERVKEIVKNCSDDEIYVMLEECNMNPDEAVQKLLLQDDFLEVKSKRERKKENKEASESRSQYLSTTSSHTLGHGGSTQYYSSDFEASGGKSTYEEEYRSNPSSCSSTYASGKEVRRSISNNPGTQRQIWQKVDVNKSTQPLAGSQSACVGVSSPLTMADNPDILKIDKVNNNVSSIPTVSTRTSCSLRDTVASNKCQNVENPSIRSFLQDDLILELGCSEDPVLENSEKITSEMSTDPSSLSNFHTRMDNLHLGSHLDDVQAPTITFGSYRPFASKPSITDPKKAPSSGSASSIGHFATRDSEDFGHNHLKSTSNRILVSRTAGNGAVDSSSSVYSQPDAAHGHRYTSSRPDSTLERGTLLDSAQAYSLQSVNPGVFSTSELNQQPNLSSGYFADAVGSFYSHETNAYIPSASQQRAMMNNYTYQFPTATGDTSRVHTRPQLRNSLSTGYGGFEISADISEILKLNRNVMPTRTATEDLYRFKYDNNGSAIVPVSQNGGSVRLVSGPGSRTLPPVLAQQFQNFQGPDTQLRSDLQQVQDYLQQYGEGYPDLHHAQIGARNFLEQAYQRPISQRRWDSRQFETHSQQYGAQGYPKLYHSKIGSQNLQEQILMDRTSDNSGQQYQNYQGLNPQLRWDLQQVQEHSRPYGAQGYPNFHHSQIGARNLQEQILMDRISDSSLDYTIPQHSSTGASRNYQDPIVGDRFLGSSARYPNLQHSQMESFQKYQDQS